jgi:hypothetical protein
VVVAMVVVIATKEVMEATLLPEVVHAKNGAQQLQLVDHKLGGSTYYRSSGSLVEGGSAAISSSVYGGFFEFIGIIYVIYFTRWWWSY